jgi:hypothetical protein
MGDYLDVDARGLSIFAAFGFPKRVGQGGEHRLSRHLPRRPRGAESPANAHTGCSFLATFRPSSTGRSVAYDAETNGFIRKSPVVGFDSYNQAMQRNTDGSIDLYFGPEAAAATESNWIYTAPGRPWFPGFRLYDPTLRSSTGFGYCRIWKH